MDFIEELTGTPPELSDESTETEQPTSQEDESIETSAEAETVEEPTETEEEPQEDGTEAKLAELQAQLEKAEQRMRDKDKYINELQRNKADEARDDFEESHDDVDVDFWDDPETAYKLQNQKLEQLQFQLAEQTYARKHPDYYDVVKLDEVNAAMAKDADFANEFNSSANKFETAYTYLKKQADVATKSQADLREQIKAELMAEMNIKPKKEVPKSISTVGNGSPAKQEVPDDGFSNVFGLGY